MFRVNFVLKPLFGTTCNRFLYASVLKFAITFFLLKQILRNLNLILFFCCEITNFTTLLSSLVAILYGSHVDSIFYKKKYLSSLVWIIMLRVCHTTPTLNGPVCSILSGWATTMSRLFGPKMALGVFLKDTATRTASGVGQGFATFWLLARRSSNWAAPQLLSVTTSLTIQRSSHPVNYLAQVTTSGIASFLHIIPF